MSAPDLTPDPTPRCAACNAPLETKRRRLCRFCEELQDGDGNAPHFQPEST